MTNGRGKVTAIAFALACIAALFGSAVLSLIPDPIWVGDYFSVWEFGAGEPGVDDYNKYLISTDHLLSKILIYWHQFECHGHSCYNSSGGTLVISDDIMTLTFRRDSPYFTANIEKFCYRKPYKPNWTEKHIFNIFFQYEPANAPINVTVYDKDGNVVYQGEEGKSINLDPPVAYAIYVNDYDFTLAVAYKPSTKGALLQTTTPISMFDKCCEQGMNSYPVKAYFALAKGNHPEFAYDVYCMAFEEECTPQQPEQTQWNIDWELILLIVILLIVFLIVVS